ncbi:hypothetical protein D3C76_803400 [compost metagenome]
MVDASQFYQLDSFRLFITVTVGGCHVLDVHAPHRHHHAQAQGHCLQVDVVRLDVRTTAVVATALVVLLELLVDVAWDFKASLVHPFAYNRVSDDLVHVLHHRFDFSADEVTGPDLFGRQVFVYFEIEIPKLVLRLGW